MSGVVRRTLRFVLDWGSHLTSGRMLRTTGDLKHLGRSQGTHHPPPHKSVSRRLIFWIQGPAIRAPELLRARPASCPPEWQYC